MRYLVYRILEQQREVEADDPEEALLRARAFDLWKVVMLEETTIELPPPTERNP